MTALRRLGAHASVWLAPLWVAQGLYVRATIGRLPEAPPPSRGVAGNGARSLRLLLAGESTVAGVGASGHQDGLAGHTARAVAAACDATVEWQVIAANGLTAGALAERIHTLPDGVRADLVVVGVGANDVFRFHGPRRWTRDLDTLSNVLRRRFAPAPVLLSAMPPVGRFPGLPQPLRSALGLRAELLDAATRRFARCRAGVAYLPLDIEFAPELFAADGVHPSPLTYRLWAEAIAAAVQTHT